MAKHVLDMGVGARLRGVEATVDGALEKRGKQFVLRVPGTGDLLPLASLTKKVQWNLDAKRLESPKSDERRACKRLLAGWKGELQRVRITGPLVRKSNGTLALEVRRFNVVAP